jgi:hypothetical protein
MVHRRGRGEKTECERRKYEETVSEMDCIMQIANTKVQNVMVTEVPQRHELVLLGVYYVIMTAN